jgi:small GTP-binding protein
VHKTNMNAFYRFFTLGNKENGPSTPNKLPANNTKSNDVQPEYIVKIVIVGAPGVGKTSIVQRFSGQPFSKTYTPTVGIDMSSVELKRKSKILVQKFGMGIRCSIFDVPHTELRGKHVSKILDGAHAFIIVFDITDPKSIQPVDQWRALLPRNANILLIANKCDKGRNVIKPTNLDAYVRDAGFMGWHMINCKNSSSVRDAMNHLVDRILRQFWKKYEGLPLDSVCAILHFLNLNR